MHVHALFFVSHLGACLDIHSSLLDWLFIGINYNNKCLVKNCFLLNLMGGYQYFIRNMTIALSPLIFFAYLKRSIWFWNILQIIATKASQCFGGFTLLKTLVTKDVCCPIPRTPPPPLKKKNGSSDLNIK